MLRHVAFISLVIGAIAALSPAAAQPCASYMYHFTNGSTIDANQVNANFSCAALTSGATFAGNTTFPGATVINSSGFLGLGMSPTNVLDITQTQNSASTISLVNANPGTAAQSKLLFTAGTTTGSLSMFGSGFAASGIFRPSGLLLEGQGSGGLTLGTNGNYPIYFSINRTQVGLFDATGLTTVLTNSTGLPLTTGVTGNLAPTHGGKPSNRYTNFGGIPSRTITGTSWQMSGWGSWLTITPNSTGNIRVTMVVQYAGQNAYSAIQLAMGTGTPPAPYVGAYGGVGSTTNFQPNLYASTTLLYESYGNAIGVPLWVDVAGWNNTAGQSMIIYPLSVIIEEF